LSTRSLYDKADHEARSFEGHFKAYLSGKIRRNRKRLTGFAIPRFQTQVRRELGIRIGRARIRVGIEREELALSASKRIGAEFLVISYHGKHHVTKRLPTETFSLPKSSRRRPRKRRLLRRVRVKRMNRTRAIAPATGAKKPHTNRTRKISRKRRRRLG